MNRRRYWSDRLAIGLSLAYLGDRALKLAAVERFFARRSRVALEHCPSVSLIQPVTRGSTSLEANLRARRALRYPGDVQHVLICDATDEASLHVCQRAVVDLKTANGPNAGVLVEIQATRGAITSKVEKMRAGVACASGAVLCFVDDDVAMRADALQILIEALAQPGIGAAFGLANYTTWDTMWSSLMSLFVNANALVSYIPATYLTPPFTITGHCFALRRGDFATVGGLVGMDDHIDDDHALALRLRERGWRLAQTRAIYEVANVLDSRHAYLAQMKRWFVFPRQALLPFLSARERLVTFAGSVSAVVPGMLALLAVVTRRRAVGIAFICAMVAHLAGYAWLDARFLQRRTPARRYLLLPFVALMTPFHIAAILLGDADIEWRGRRLRIFRGGAYSELGSKRDKTKL
jgi:ceramide glucosyltransferase